MPFKIKIKRICVRPRDFEIDAKVSGEKLGKSVAFDKKYYLTFNTALGWSPYEAVRKIASHMAEQTGKARKVFGRVIRDKMLQITEDEFEKRIYYLWNFSKYEYRIGERGVFRIDNLVKDNLFEQKDKKFRMAFGQALFQKQGGKKSDKAAYWLGDYNTTKIEFDPDYTYEPSRKYEPLSSEQCLYLGISLARLGTESINEEYILKSIEYFKFAVAGNRKNALAYMNWGGALLTLAQIRRSKALFLESLKITSLALKCKKDLYQIYLNRGVALHHLAEIFNKSGLYEKAINNFKKSIELKEDHSFSYFCCANSIHNLASINEDIGLLKECCKYYRKAVQYNEKDFKSYTNLANALSMLGEKTKDENYFKDSINNHQLAAEHGDKDPMIFLDWGISLLRYYHTFERDHLIEQSTDVLFNAYLLAILQKKWDFAIHIAVSALLDVSKKSGNKDVLLLTAVFLQAIQIVDTGKGIDSESIEKLREWKGDIEEADIVIDAILGEKKKKPIPKTKKDSILMKCALFLAKEITSKG